MEQCVKLGEPATQPSECCKQGNLSVGIDDLSQCCAGKACCSATNHSHHINSSDCACDDGYEREQPDNDTNYVCKQVFKPDLVVTDQKAFIYYTPVGSFYSLVYCINKDDQGRQINRGDYVKITNKGNKDAGSYEVEVGLANKNKFPQTCSMTIHASGTKKGVTSIFSASFCCDLGIVYAGTYHFYANADVSDNVEESNEDNNEAISNLNAPIP